MRITCACPSAMVADGNNLAMALGFSDADGETYVGLNWQDADGNLYAAASFVAREEWIVAAQSPLARPSWDIDQTIDMIAAARAQSSLVFSTTPRPASPTSLTAIGGMDGVAALLAMGLMLS